MSMNVAVLGAGSWGTALSILLARNQHQVHLLGRDAAEIEQIQADRENKEYLPGHRLPENIKIGLIEDMGTGHDFVVVAVPSSAVRACVASIPGDNEFIVLASKGLEPGTSKLLSQVAKEEKPNALVGAISGPNLAVEIVQGIPTAALAACPDETAVAKVCEAFQSRSFRVYYSDDLIGIELAGALKNVLAIGAGMADGLGYGDNTKGALLARGLGEMTRLGLKMNAKIDTFFGIAGVGDLFATASSKLSRNYRVGIALGKGQSVQEALASIGQVAEGINTAECVDALAKEYGVELPILSLIHRVIQGHVKASDAVSALMEREPRRECLMP